jgi:Sigma-70 region 2
LNNSHQRTKRRGKAPPTLAGKHRPESEQVIHDRRASSGNIPFNACTVLVEVDDPLLVDADDDSLGCTIVVRDMRDSKQRNARRGDASRYIRSLLDRATGQPPGAAKMFLEEVQTIVEAGTAPPDWRRIVETEYPWLVQLLDWVGRYDVEGKPRKRVQSGSSALTEEQRKRVVDHLPLVRSLARERAGKINNLAGGTTFDHALFAELEGIGLQVLEERVKRWDQARGVTFGAFARTRVAGAMDNYLTRVAKDGDLR